MIPTNPLFLLAVIFAAATASIDHTGAPHTPRTAAPRHASAWSSER
jgi:hypothetical protein